MCFKLAEVGGRARLEAGLNAVEERVGGEDTYLLFCRGVCECMFYFNWYSIPGSYIIRFCSEPGRKAHTEDPHIEINWNNCETK